MSLQRFKLEELADADLVVDATYEGGRSGNAGDDPLPRLIGVSNQGGFRYLGELDSPRLIILTSSFNDPDWPDFLDRETGILTYFGDNKRPGRALHDTPRNGNQLLRNMFNSLHAKPPQREKVPPILVFGNIGFFRDMIFLGLAVPGGPEMTFIDDLVAIWKIAGSRRFQNYRASLTILDVPHISRTWLNDIKNGAPLTKNCPIVWKQWVERGLYQSLTAKKSLEHRTKNEQIPDDRQSLEIIKAIHNHFKNAPTSFERCAAKIVQLMDKNFFSFDLTRPSRDGGRDAIGLYRIGHGASAISVVFSLEAKCYELANSVGVREVSRLISRLRHRQFGILVTTSHVHAQAYREIKEDGHPIVIIAAKDIINILARSGYNSLEDVICWLELNFPKKQ